MNLWYAVYVKSRSEKKVATNLSLAGIAYYLPLQKLLKQWSDRKKWVEEPLFKSYIFVNIDMSDYYRVLQIPGVVKYITFEGKAVTIPSKQIDAIKYFLEEESAYQPSVSSYRTGQLVEVIAGSLSGITGKLVEVKGKNWLIIEIDAIQHAITIQISKNKVRPIKSI